MPLCFVLFLSLMLISAAFYPGGYNLLERTISCLGDPALNPFPGWLFFDIAFWSLSALFIPFFLWVYRHLKTIYRRIAGMALIASLMSSLGMIMLGFFPQGSATQDLHDLSAGLSFGGFLVSSALSWIPMIKDIITKGKEKRNFSPFILVFMACTFIIAFSGVIVSRFSYPPPASWYAGYPFWEWSLLFAIAIHTALLAIIIPEEIRM